MPFYIVRFLPLPVSELLYSYLVLIRPLIRYLHTELDLPGPKQPHYLWLTYSWINTKPMLDHEDPKTDLEEEDSGLESDEEEEEEEEEGESDLEPIASVEKQGF